MTSSVAPKILARRLIRALSAGLVLVAATPAAAQYAELGSVDFESSGAPAARPAFMRGVAALHSFWYGEARELFLEAQAIDPDFALAYWGEAMSYDRPLWDGQDVEAGRRALAKLAPTAAERAAKAPTEREKAWLAAVEALYGEGDARARRAAYDRAMLELANRYPQDPEAATFYALTLLAEQHAGMVGVRERMRAAAILERLFDAQPRHPGVLHYLIHAYDDPVHAPLGLRPALVYAEVAPGSPHALHMPSHIFLQLGMWQPMVSSNEASYLASLAWVERRDLAPTERDFHSLGWLSYGYAQLGRHAEAAECVRLTGVVADASGDADVEAERRSMLARYVVESGDHAALPATIENGGNAYAEAGLRLAAALAAAEQGDSAAARRHAERVEALRAARAAEGNVYLERLLAIIGLEARALAERAAGRVDAALAAAHEATRAEDGTDPSGGPPEAFKPAHELYGELLLAAGRTGEAAAAFRRSLDRAPGRALSTLGLARAAAAAGDAAEARARYQELLALWSEADADHPRLAEARAALAGAGER